MMVAGGPAMYERFTDRSRKVMKLANEEARRFNHEYVGTEHMLLGLVKEGSGVAANVLKNLDVDLRKVRREVERVVQTAVAADAWEAQKLPFTPRAKEAIEVAMKEARGLHHNYIGTEHLLLGLIGARESVAAQVLLNFGLTADRIRTDVQALLGLSPAAPADTPLVREWTAPSPPEAFALETPREIQGLVAALDRRIEALEGRKVRARDAEQFEVAATLRERQHNLTRARDAILREWRSDAGSGDTP
jgi:ATP-dependent Clp protease ATP-binding subunit ClpA